MSAQMGLPKSRAKCVTQGRVTAIELLDADRCFIAANDCGGAEPIQGHFIFDAMRRTYIFWHKDKR